MNIFSCKKGSCIADSEGEDDSFPSETVLHNNVDMHIFQKKMHCERENIINNATTPVSLDNSIINYETPVSMLQESKNDMKNKNYIFSEEESTKNDNSEETFFLSNGNYASHMNVQRDSIPIMNIDGRDDEIQLSPSFNQSKIDEFETMENRSTVNCREETCLDQNTEIFRLCQQEKSETQLFSLAACDINPLRTNGCSFESNVNASLSSNDIESTTGLRNDVSRKKGKKMRRSKTAKDDLRKEGRMKRYSSLGSYHDHVDTLSNTSIQHYELRNDFSETVFSKDIIKSNKYLFSKDSDHRLLDSCDINDHYSTNHNALLDGDCSRTIHNDSKMHECKSQLTEHQGNSQSDTDKGLKTPESCRDDSETLKIGTYFSVSNTVEIVEKVLDNVDVNTLQLIDDKKNTSKSKDQQLTPPMEIFNTVNTQLTPTATSSISKESVRRSIITKPYYRVGLSKKAKVEPLHSYLKK
ncbi:hypothetical protein PMAC_002034 [Pneumocystis sp. 'macacae']|nr:hypothetical protein PMAC_002034 [Pneumocystis sp. 'macacae']